MFDGRMRAFLLKAATPGLLILILAGAAAACWSASTQRAAKSSSVFDAVENLVRGKQITPEIAARIAAKALNADPSASNSSFTFFRSDRDLRAALQEVGIRIPARAGLPAGPLAVLTVSTAPCITTSAVMQRFGTEPEVNLVLITLNREIGVSS